MGSCGGTEVFCLTCGFKSNHDSMVDILQQEPDIFCTFSAQKTSLCMMFFFLAKGTIFLKPQDFVAKTVSWMCHFLCSQG